MIDVSNIITVTKLLILIVYVIRLAHNQYLISPIQILHLPYKNKRAKRQKYAFREGGARFGVRDGDGIWIGVIILRINLLMTNKCKRIKKNTKHFFVLSGREDLYFRQEVAVCFKPFNKTKTRTATSITPTFNHDRKHYTYSFILPFAPPENQQQLEADHRKRVAESLIEIEDILLPKPRSRHKYCGVCRGHYEDYKQHIEGIPHNTFLKRSTYQALIIDLSQHIQGMLQRRDQKQIQECKTIDLTCEQNSQNPQRLPSQAELSPQKSECLREE